MSVVVVPAGGYCGWHSYFPLNEGTIKYSFVGDGSQCSFHCVKDSLGANGHVGADGMASVIAHELSEAATDPELSAWYDENRMENANRQHTTDNRQQTTDNRQQTTDSRQQPSVKGSKQVQVQVQAGQNSAYWTDMSGSVRNGSAVLTSAAGSSWRRTWPATALWPMCSWESVTFFCR